MTGLLDLVAAADPPPFALLHRRGTDPDSLDVIVGKVSSVDTLADVPLTATGPGHEVLVLMPYRQIAERGYSCVDDGTPLLVLEVTGQEVLPLAEALPRLPDVPIAMTGGEFDVDDDGYAEIARQVVGQEIGHGEGSNFVIKRSFVADITGYSTHSALTLFRRLARLESGTYWTFVVHTGQRTLVGASPERHVSLTGGTAVMNPISGTYRYPPTGPTLPDVLDFLGDAKETDELFMVVDEELKMMGRVCATGGRVHGPYLKEMTRLAHTEYLIEGRTSLDVRDVLRETMFAPTVTGSPLENACRIISRYEPDGRGYYSGVAALIGRDAAGERTMDSAILIRTADIDPAGRMRIGVGSTLVRHSRPESEAAESRAKAAGLLAAFSSPGAGTFGRDPSVLRALGQRNERVAGHWLRPQAHDVPELAGRTVLVVDAEDTFTSMLGHLLRSLGLTVTIARFDEPYAVAEHDLVVMGPGPGDPYDDDDPRIQALTATIRHLLDEDRPFLSVCLSHQVLSRLLGFPLHRRPVPNQGAGREIDLFGRRVRVGFYNSFAALCDQDKVDCDGRVVEVSRDEHTGEVHALRGNGFRSLQFHAESVLSKDGLSIIRELLVELVGR
ncbi:chorismate-binding protein [Lentzea sp. NEAU-D7]|uniref:chorismate-binding protein n=1 Tax=Lentzea sp. NEAU-D7 TaxID=2994667 RepID=UPI00224AFCA1|nr:chorismate-binding protein [Lentzea sp. NEAU-D7]MCX2953925.1 chorismate-binding protein [Lentzea sp. NEAU-D7]